MSLLTKKIICAMLLTFSIVSCTNAGTTQIEQQDFPFSSAVRVGDMLYLSGVDGVQANGQVISGGLTPETKLAMKKIEAILKNNNATLSNLVYCQVMLTNINDWSEFNSIYKTYFPNNQYPARTAFATTALALNTHVEITCTAAVGELANHVVFQN